MARKVGAAGYLECSARLNVGVDQVFEQSVKTALLAASRPNKAAAAPGQPQKKERNCIIC